MKTRIAGRIDSRLPAGDDHPYRTGAWRPQSVEHDADEIDVVEGRIPADLAGVYLRNTENPVMPALGRYHPFDGDGMLHAIRFAGGAASYRNRFVRTAGLAAELEAGAPLWAGIIEPPATSQRDGWGARGRMKDASSTDVAVHGGVALTTFYQCGDAYRHDPVTLEPLGTAPWVPSWGISAHPKVDVHTGELLWFAYSKEAPFLRYGVVDAEGRAVHQTDVPLPGPRLPHDMAFTERFAIFNDFPLFWDPALLDKGVHRAKLFDLPSRFALVPRRGGEVRWFDAAPTYVLHFANAFDDGDEVVLDGFHQRRPSASLDMNELGCRPWRWRFDLRTGRTREEPLGDVCCEFPTIDARDRGRRYRHMVTATGTPGMFTFDGLARHDLDTGAVQRFRFPDGVVGSEAPVAGRHVVTFVSDVPRDRSECWIFDAETLEHGPIARVALPERIASGTHACWSPSLPG